MATLNADQITTLTFDCYGTLIDYEAGTIAALRPLLDRHNVTLSDDAAIRTCQEIEAPLCEPPHRSYKDVLRAVVDGFGTRFGFKVSAADRDILVRSLPEWRPFPDTVDSLRLLQRRYRLAIISNVDDDLAAGSLAQLPVSFTDVVTAEQTRCYKPRRPIFEQALRRLDARPGAVAHIAEGADEIVPARELGCATVWVRRNGRSARFLTEPPDLEVADLQALPTALNTRA